MPHSHTYSFDAAAARLNIGRNTLTRKLREIGLLTSENLPAGRERGGPHFCMRSHTYRHPIKGWVHYNRTEITRKGLDFIRFHLEIAAQQAIAVQATQPSTTSSPIGSTGILHDAGELIVITPDGERTHHRAAMVIVFETATDLQCAINAQRCVYQIRRDIPEEQLHPALTAKRN